LQDLAFNANIFPMGRNHLSSLLKSALIGLFVSAFYLGILHPFSLLEIPKLKTQDLFFAVRHLFVQPRSVLKDIVLITADDESIEKIHERWPFKRRIYAELLNRISAANPRLIGLDFIFSGKGEPSDDFLLSQAIQESGKVILASFVDAKRNYVLPLEEFRTKAQASGVVNKLLDPDLHVRRAGLFYRDKEGKTVSWPWEVEILISFLGLERGKFELTHDGVFFNSRTNKTNFFVPVYDHKGMMINYRFNLNDIDRIPLWKALEAKDLSDRLRGKIVLAGATSKILHDDYHTPLGLMSGIVVNTNLLANLLAKDFLKKIPLFLNVSFVFLFVFLASYLGLEGNVLRSLILLSLATGVFFGGFFALFANNYLGDCFSPFLGGWLSFLSIAFYRYFHIFLENVQLKGKVVTDPLTGLYNRRVLESRIDTELEKLTNAKRERKTDPLFDLSVLMVDIDNFKKINDTYGHQFGDDVLKNISFSIKENTRKDDLVARFGGEEFCVILPHTNKEEASQIAEKIRASVQAKKFNYVNQVATFTVSIGVASAKTDHLLASRTLIRAADTALYEAKRTGKNKVSLYQEKG